MKDTKKPEKVNEEPKYRYVCQGCTNNALETTNMMINVLVTCKTCGMTQTTRPENYIAL